MSDLIRRKAPGEPWLTEADTGGGTGVAQVVGPYVISHATPDIVNTGVELATFDAGQILLHIYVICIEAFDVAGIFAVGWGPGVTVSAVESVLDSVRPGQELVPFQATFPPTASKAGAFSAPFVDLNAVIFPDAASPSAGSVEIYAQVYTP